MASNRAVNFAILWIAVVVTAWVAEPYVVALWALSSLPRAVTPRASLTEAEQTTIKVFDADSPSVVHVFAQGAPTTSMFDETQQGVVQSGSGIVWDAAGHVITNYHVINGTEKIGAKLTSGEFVGAKVVGVAPNYDLAVLQLDRPHSPLHVIPVGRSSDLRVGQAVYAIGNPYGLEQTLTSGIISALQRRLPTQTPYEIVGVIQTDAPINPGNSGGPLLDDAGRVIGINSAIISGSGASAGIGFAIPVDVVNRIATQLIREGRVPLPGIGIIAAREEDASRLGINGVIVLRTVPGSPAAKVGLEGAAENGGDVADVITAADGQKLHSMSDLASLFEQDGVGHRITLTVTRDGQSRTVELPIADMAQ